MTQNQMLSAEDMSAAELAAHRAMMSSSGLGPSMIERIKAECRRRILLIMSEDQQRNTLAAGQAATMQYGADTDNWPVELQARHVAAMGAWAEIERLRARSNEIEAMEPLPADVAADELWAVG